MFDPMTVAFDFGWLVIWHKDPCRDGTDDSCDWPGWRRRRLRPREQELLAAIEDVTHALGNYPYYTDPKIDPVRERLERAAQQWTKRSRWRIHPRWHIWHWRIQCRPLQDLKRWLWGRCCRCGGRFRWGESVVGLGWHGDGPKWFRSEAGTCHASCYGDRDRSGAVGGQPAATA